MKELNLDRILKEVSDELGADASPELLEQEFLAAVEDQAREAFHSESRANTTDSP